MDVVPASVRSRMMAGIRGRDTRPEVMVRKALFAAGFRFRLHRRDLPGTPDIVLAKHRLAIFVHGCFWHQHPGCRLAAVPGSNQRFWLAKLERNTVRDAGKVAQLLISNWRVLLVWECATRSLDTDELQSLLSGHICSDARLAAIEGAVRAPSLGTRSGARPRTKR